ncbi:MAG: hypothetical protein NC397_09905 [Clostridium sp.]|nr:hypothetical protein [Clostridium sp.]
MRENNKKMNRIGREERYLDIVNNRLRQFALLNNSSYSDLAEDDDLFCYHTCVILNNFEVHFYCTFNLSAGYPFMEIDEDSSEYCLLTRFKFGFSDTYFSPYDIHNLVGDNDFRTLDFHYLITEDVLNKALDNITNFITRHSFELSQISTNALYQEQLTSNYKMDMQIVSKKITDEKLKKNFGKYSKKHEFNLYFHNLEHQPKFNAFAAKGKSKELQRILSKYSAKGWLTIFEQRYMDYLMKTDFQKPDEDKTYFISSTRKSNKYTSIIVIISFLLAFAISIVIDLLIWNLVDETIVANNYTILSSSDSLQFMALIAVPLAAMLSLLFRDLFFANTTGKAFIDATTKKGKAILLVICCIVLAGGVYLDFLENHNYIALNDKGVYYSDGLFDNEVIPYSSGRVEMFYIDGYSYYDSDDNVEYSDSSEDKDLYLVVDGDYENHTYSYDISGYEDSESKLDAAVAIYEKATGKKVEHFKDEQSFAIAYGFYY